jgi:hypothetical protein
MPVTYPFTVSISKERTERRMLRHDFPSDAIV